MLKNILNINGIKELSKKQQIGVLGGNGCSTYNGPMCYGARGCASCDDYHALPPEHQMCVLVSVNCFDQ